MIKNEKQYKITRKLLSQWEENYRLLRSKSCTDATQWVYKEQLHSAKEEIHQLKTQLKEYEAIKVGKRVLPDLKLVEGIPELLVKWRIARRLTQKELAEQLHMHENQIQRYENTDYAAASLATILEIAHVLRQSGADKGV